MSLKSFPVFTPDYWILPPFMTQLFHIHLALLQ
jgi:hypothetical protein